MASATLFIKSGEHGNTVTPAIAAGQKADDARALKKKIGDTGSGVMHCLRSISSPVLLMHFANKKMFINSLQLREWKGRFYGTPAFFNVYYRKLYFYTKRRKTRWNWIFTWKSRLWRLVWWENNYCGALAWTWVAFALWVYWVFVLSHTNSTHVSMCTAYTH